MGVRNTHCLLVFEGNSRKILHHPAERSASAEEKGWSSVLRLRQLDFTYTTDTGLALRVAQDRVSASQVFDFRYS